MFIVSIAAAIGLFPVLSAYNTIYGQIPESSVHFTQPKIAQTTDPHTAVRNRMQKEGFDPRYMTTSIVHASAAKNCAGADVVEYSIGGYIGGKFYEGYGCVNKTLLAGGYPSAVRLSYRPK
jgi:hypothetical protein